MTDKHIKVSIRHEIDDVVVNALVDIPVNSLQSKNYMRNQVHQEMGSCAARNRAQHFDAVLVVIVILTG